MDVIRHDSLALRLGQHWGSWVGRQTVRSDSAGLLRVLPMLVFPGEGGLSFSHVAVLRHLSCNQAANDRPNTEK